MLEQALLAVVSFRWRLAIQRHEMTRADQQRTAFEPYRIVDLVRDGPGRGSVTLQMTVRDVCLLGQVDLPATAPARSIVKVGHTLLTEQLDPMSKPDGQNRLAVWRSSPV